MKIVFLFLGLFLFSCKPEASLLIAGTLNSSNPPLYSIFQNKIWVSEIGSEDEEFYLHFENKIEVKKIFLESCLGTFRFPIQLDINDREITTLMDIHEEGKASISFDPKINLQDIRISFHNKNNLCIRDIQFFNSNLIRYDIKPAEIVSGSITPMIRPQSVFYHTMNIFDSNLENSFVSKNLTEGFSFQIQFTEVQKIEKIIIWNGYRRSLRQCNENGRIKRFSLIGDRGYSETIHLKDTIEPQFIKLNTLFRGRNLKIDIEEGYKGLKSDGFALAEMRFFNGRNWFLIDSSGYFQEIKSSYVEGFKKSGMKEILNRNLSTAYPGSESILFNKIKPRYLNDESDEEEDDDDDLKLNPKDVEILPSWNFRFQSDGKFFIQRAELINGDTQSSLKTTFAVGNYEIGNKKENRIEIRLVGLANFDSMNKYDFYPKNNKVCQRNDNSDYIQQKRFSAYLTLQKIEETFFIRNFSYKKFFNFDSLEILNEVY